MSTMLAARLNLRTGRLAVQRIAVPQPGPGQVRIRVGAAGICLSDVHLIDGTLKPLFATSEEVTLGHETAGTIDAIGPDVPEAWKVGQRVILQVGERCRRCRNCLSDVAPCLAFRTRGIEYDGGWAEYALATSTTLVPIPDDLPFEEAAIIPDAVSTPWAAIVTTARVSPARAVGVWGIGGLGAHTIQLLRLVGAAPIVAIDPLESARARAVDLGADAVFDPSDSQLAKSVRDLTRGEGLAYAFDMAGAPAVREQAVACLGHGGRLVLVGLAPKPVVVKDSVAFSFAQQSVVGHYGSAPEHVLQLVSLARLHRLRLTRSISGRLPLSEAEKGVAQLASKVGSPIRLVLVP
jgi:D-arabinose 1-dehydrogenase-like Zn-dependent alcohol dehydrogenase